MFNMIEIFMKRLTKEQVNNFALNNSIYLSGSELDFTYEFIMKNWQQILANPGMLDLEKYKDKYSSENYPKIQKLLIEYFSKYKNYL